MPRVAPTRLLNDILFCTGAKSGRPRFTIFWRCQFSLNQPRLSAWMSREMISSPEIGVFLIASSGIALTGPASRSGSRSPPLWRHHASLAWYHSMVAARPALKSERDRPPTQLQPELVESMA